MKNALVLVLLISLIQGCGVNYVPAEKENRYVFNNESVNENLLLPCPCEYLRGWAAVEKFFPNERSFERRYTKFLKGNITISYNYYEDLYKKNPKLYSDDVRENVEAWRNVKVYDGETSQYRNAESVIYPPQDPTTCAYLEYGSSMHGKPEDNTVKLASGWHQRKLSCPIRETEVRDGLYITYSLNVLPGYKKGKVAPHEAMRDIERTVRYIAKNIVLENNGP